MRTRLRTAVYGTTTILAIAVGAFIAPAMASAHGAMTAPGSRTYFCYKDGLSGGGGDITPVNSACATAVASHGKQPLWDYFGILRSDSGGSTFNTTYIPDGQLCSGGSVKYGGTGTGYNLPGTNWPVTHLTSGAAWDWHYIAIAPHPGNYRMYITKSGWDPNQPLRWSDLETTPFLTVNPPLTQGAAGAEYRWSGNLPTRTGRHIIYSVWTRSDSMETFYNCSDVVFDGGAGEVTGIGAGPAGPPDTQAPTAPGPAVVSNLGTGALTLTWPAATDNNAIAAYIVYQKQGANPEAAAGATSTTSMDVTGLTPNTAYTFTVRARDAAGNLSTASTAVAATTPATGPVGGGGGGGGPTACTATYKITNPWPGGFQAEIAVKNTSTAPFTNWTVSFNYIGDEKITSLWNAVFTQNLKSVTVKNPTWGSTIPPNGTLVVGFTANVTGTSALPTGLICTSP